MRLSTKIAYNTIIQIVSKLLATLLGLAAIALITRYLGQYGFGQYTTIVTFASFFAIIADLGLTLVTVQLISRPEADENKILGNLMSLRLFTAILFLGLAPLCVIFFPYDPMIKLGIAVTVLSFLFASLNQIFVGLFQKNLRMEKVSVAEVINRIILVIGTIYAIQNDMGLMAILVIMVLSSFLNFLILYYFSREFVRIKMQFDFSYWKIIMSKSWPLAITIVLNLLYLKTDTLLLSVIKRPTEIGIIEEVGLYGAAYRVIDVLITVPFMFAGIILPVLTARWAAKDSLGFKTILQKSFDVMIIFAIPLIIGTQFIASDAMVLVAGKEFSASGPILQILIIAAAMIFLGCMFSHAIIAIDKQKKIISAYMITAVTSLIGYFVFIPKFSYFGAAWVTIYSETFIAIAAFYLVWKYTKFFPNLLIVLKSLAASAIMAGLIVYMQNNGYSHLSLVLGFSITTYFLALIIFKGITKQDLLDLLNK